MLLRHHRRVSASTQQSIPSSPWQTRDGRRLHNFLALLAPGPPTYTLPPSVYSYASSKVNSSASVVNRRRLPFHKRVFANALAIGAWPLHMALSLVMLPEWLLAVGARRRQNSAFACPPPTSTAAARECNRSMGPRLIISRTFGLIDVFCIGPILPSLRRSLTATHDKYNFVVVTHAPLGCPSNKMIQPPRQHII